MSQEYGQQKHINKLIETNIERWSAICKQMLDKSYCVYSNFPVACALIAEDGQIFTGCNVENSSYGLAICAERTAAVKAVSEGIRKFKVCVVMTKAATFTQPCGACRQFLTEFGYPDLVVVSVKLDGSFETHSLSELMPYCFSSDDVKPFK